MYLRIKKFIENNGFKKADLRNMVRDRPPLLIHSDEIELKRCECLSDSADDIKVSKQTLIYAYEKNGLLLLEGKVELKFSTLSGLRINIYLQLDKYQWLSHPSECNREVTLCLWE